VSAVSNEQFLEAMFADTAPGMHTIVCSFLADPYKATRADWRGWAWAPGGALPRGFDTGNTYLTVSTFEPDPQTGERRRRKANFCSLHAVMIDDLGTKVAPDKMLLPPSALIETSPDNYQAYLFVVQDEAARDRRLCERLIDAMVAAGLTADGSDPGMKGVTRNSRLPVGINSKGKYVERLGHPFPVRCSQYAPGRRYAIAEIAAAWSLELTPPTPRALAIPHPAEAARMTRRFDALLRTFELKGMYRGRIGPGPWHAVRCPWVHTHTDGAEGGTAVAEPGTDNNFYGGFQCHHGHCADRTMADVWQWVKTLFDDLSRLAGADE